MEDGILKHDLLSLEKVVPDDSSFVNFRTVIVYKHFLLFLKQGNTKNNCFVLDTQKGTFVNSVIKGQGLEGRHDYFLSYWKDNLFVLFGGKFKSETLPTLANLNSNGYERPAFGVDLLEVNDENYQISFTIKSFNLEKKGNTTGNPVHIYKDSLYVLEGFGSVNPKAFEVSKFDLNANKWNLCEIKGEAPKPRHGFATTLFNNKLYIFGGFHKISGGFFVSQAAGDVFALDLDNMQWIKVLGEGFPSLNASGSSTAEVVGQKIYIQHDLMNEFTIFDPANKTIQYTQYLSPKSGWTIRSFKNQSVLFHFAGGNWGAPYVEYQDFLTPTLPNQTESEVKVEQVELPGTQLIQSKKNILSHPRHIDLLWKEKPFADVTFVAENEEIQAHRIMLLKCSYFQNMFNSGMAEASSNKINVPDISPTNFKAILEYIYFDKITLTEQLALDLIILADKYCLIELETDCENYLCNHLGAENLLRIIKINETLDSAKLEDRIVSFLIGNVETLQEGIGLHNIPRELLAQAIIRMKQIKLAQNKLVL